MEFDKLNGIEIEDDDDDQINNEIDINEINVNMVSHNSLKGSKVSYSNKLQVLKNSDASSKKQSNKNENLTESESKGYTESVSKMTPQRMDEEKSKKSPSKTQMEFSNTKKLMIKETPVMLKKFEDKKSTPQSNSSSGNLYA